MKGDKRISKGHYAFALSLMALMLLGGSSCSTKKSIENVGQKSTVETKSPKKVAEKGRTEELKDDEIFTIVGEVCEFPGGMKALMTYLSEHIDYPELAHKQGIQGRVIVSFVVTKDGSIRNVRIVRSVHPLLDTEAVRVIKGMPKWKPGKVNGKPVNQRFTLPLQFRLMSPKPKQK